MTQEYEYIHGHKVIDSVPILNIAQLKALVISKQECFANLGKTFDYALPQDWLNDFSDWCKCHPMRSFVVTYDAISSTTVWIYPESMPATCCSEVYYTYCRYVEDLRKGK